VSEKKSREKGGYNSILATNGTKAFARRWIFRENVILVKCHPDKRTSGQMSSGKYHPGKCISEQMFSR
jgi:hypothetical protein